jgi:2,5-furandicarboxylate decarboxylase 1
MTSELLGDLGRIIERLDERGRLVRVTSEVDPVHDLAGVAARLEGRPAAVLFERVKGHDRPVFTGLYWSRALAWASSRRSARSSAR